MPLNELSHVIIVNLGVYSQAVSPVTRSVTALNAHDLLTHEI